MLRAVKNYGVLTAARIKALGLTQTELAEEIKKRRTFAIISVYLPSGAARKDRAAVPHYLIFVLG